MPRPFLRPAALLGAFLAALAALTGPALAAGSGRAAGSARPEPSSRLLLINGARVAFGDNGGTPVIFPAGRGLAAMVQVLRLGSRRLVIPLAALPFVGRGLSPSLFEPSALARAERDGRLPLTLRFRGRLHAPPGVTVTRTWPGTAEGYLTAAGARELGAALGRQVAADHDRGSYGTDGLFAGGLSLALPGPPGAPVTARPGFPMHTLTVTATTMNGKPDTGDEVTVLSVNDAGAIGLAGASNFFYQGSVKYSVPAGTYWAVGDFYPVPGGSDAVREVVLPQFTVRGNTTVHLSERAASSKISFAVPRRANLQTDGLSLLRKAPGNSDLLQLFDFAIGGAPPPLWVSPVTRAPADGVLRAYTSAWLTSPGHRAVPYAYALTHADPAGLISRDQRYVARPGELATVRENFYQDLRSAAASWCAGGVLGQACSGLRLPGRLVQYFTASPASYSSASYWAYADQAGGQQDAWRLLHAGEHLTDDWNRYPLHPGPSVLLPGPDVLIPGISEISGIPSAIRAGNMLSLQVIPFSDNTGGHTGGASPNLSGRYALYQDGSRIAGGSLTSPVVQARLSSRPSVIKFVLTASRASARFRLSAASSDVWTWPSRPEPRATLSAPWACRITENSTDEHCAVQGMLTLRYLVAGLSLSGTTRPGRQQISLTVGRLQEAPSSRISSVRAQVSFTGGRTWQRAIVRRDGQARFRATFTGGPSLVTLRVTARDAAGDTITETLPAAYRIAREN